MPANLRYHFKCYRSNTRLADDQTKNSKATNENDVYLAAQQKFFKAVETSLFTDGEMRTLRSLTNEYSLIRKDFGILSSVRSTYVKDKLASEFGDRVCFQKRYL